MSHNEKLKRMIDERRIEEAAINKCGFISSEFYSGAKWAINEFLKDLWHPANEKPVPVMGCNNGVLVELNETGKPITLWKREYVYENISKHGNRFISRRLDINDLLKGGEQ